MLDEFVQGALELIKPDTQDGKFSFIDVTVKVFNETHMEMEHMISTFSLPEDTFRKFVSASHRLVTTSFRVRKFSVVRTSFRGQTIIHGK